MKSQLTCLICSDANVWSQRICDGLGDIVSSLRVTSPDRLTVELTRHPTCLLLIDLQSHGVSDQLHDLRASWPNVLIIAFGVPGTTPMIAAHAMDIYAVENAEANYRRIASLVKRALDHLTITADNRRLRADAARLSAIAESATNRQPDSRPASLTVSDFSSALRQFSNIDSLLHRLADEVADTLKVARVGIFCRTRDGERYLLRADVRCVEITASLEFEAEHPLVYWLKQRAHAITRSNLSLLDDPSAHLAITQTLDQLGAEVLVPLQSRERLLGWIYVGHLSTGAPFDNSHVENLVALADCVSTTLENALLFEEVTLQKTLAETLLHALPSGIVAVDSLGVVRWCNQAAYDTLGAPLDSAIGLPVENLNRQLADILRCTLGEDGTPSNTSWKDIITHRRLSVRTERLASRTHCLGALAIIQDVTDQAVLVEKTERLERATFWAELAAGMSHEIRNPLVAIKTFAQLLPERYDDSEFRAEFSSLVSQEVDRLNGIIDQINDYAHPAPLHLAPLDITATLEETLSSLFTPEQREAFHVDISSDSVIPKVNGDAQALGRVFRHLISNAIEALANHAHPELTIILRAKDDETMPPSVIIIFKDNGSGISPENLGKVFSPFYTTKARGLGLGLPIAQRALLDHNGQITIHSNELGTSVTLLLPAIIKARL
jgi:nitrogen-specific signal transduction histidine kinase